MSAQQLRLQAQAHCREMITAVVSQRPDQIRNRLAYITANVEALADLLEEEP